MTITLTPLELSILRKTAEAFQPKPTNPYLTDPVGWVRDKLGEHLWSKQREIAESVRDNRYTAVQSCHDAGKSFISSRLVSWWLSVHKAGEAFAVTTAPTAAQVSAILWREIRRAHSKGKLDGYITSGAVPEWKLPGGEPIGYGRKPADEDQAAFQGIHALYPLIVVDEAGGVPKNLFDAVDALATNINARVLAVGNPDSPSSHFAKICKPGSGWNVIRIDGLATPNMTAEALDENPRLAELFESLGLEPSAEFVPDALRPLLLSPLWVAERIHRWGIESPIFTAKVRGEFPDIGDDVLIGPGLIREAQQRSLERSGRPILGVDVARFGMDRTTIYLRTGPVVRLVGEYSKQATTETTGRVIAAKRETDADEIRVDGVGVGAGVVDQLTELGFAVLDMQAGGAAQDKERFANAKAEWSWRLREMLEAGELDLDEDDEDLAAQLGSIKFGYTSRGQIKIESKDDLRKRGLPSPDRADAVILTAIAPAGADLFPRLPWRVWSWAPDSGMGRSVSCAGRPWPLASMRIFATVAPAQDEADFTVTSVWGRTVDGALILLDRDRRRDGDPLDGARTLVGTWQADTVYVTRRDHAMLLRAGYGAHRLHLNALDVDPDLTVLALPASAAVIGGKVWLPAVAGWREQWLAEHLAFPHSRHQGSVMTLALAVFAMATRWIPPPQQPGPPRLTVDDGPDFMRMNI